MNFDNCETLYTFNTESEVTNASNVVIAKSNYDWQDDDDVKNCYNCKREFNFFLRKHHCRACGHIYCNDCTLYIEIHSINYRYIRKNQNTDIFITMMKF